MKPDHVHRRLALLAYCLICAASASSAQVVPADRDELEKGASAGSALVAEMYGFPGPRQALDLSDSLRMGPGQVRAIAEIYEEQRALAATKGELIILKEGALEDLFEGGRPDDAEVRKLSAEIGRLRGELRAIHLIAHRKTKEVLTEQQVARYKAIREAARLRTSGTK